MKRFGGASEVTMFRQCQCTMQKTQIKGHTGFVLKPYENIIGRIGCQLLKFGLSSFSPLCLLRFS